MAWHSRGKTGWRHCTAGALAEASTAVLFVPVTIRPGMSKCYKKIGTLRNLERRSWVKARFIANDVLVELIWEAGAVSTALKNLQNCLPKIRNSNCLSVSSLFLTFSLSTRVQKYILKDSNPQAVRSSYNFRVVAIGTAGRACQQNCRPREVTLCRSAGIWAAKFCIMIWNVGCSTV